MASQQPPARPWFRLASMARPAPAATPAPAPTPTVQPQVQVRPPSVRPTFVQTFRAPVAQSQPNQPQETAPPPSQQVAAAPAITTSVPSSPITRVSAPSSSLTSSPAPKPSPTSTVLLSAASSSSVPPSPKPIVSAPSSSLPTSPSSYPTASSSSVPPSPKTKVISVPSSSLPTSPAPNAKAAVVYSPPAPAPAPPPSPVRTAPISFLMTARAADPTRSPSSRKPAVSTTALPPLTLPPAQMKTDGWTVAPKIPAEAEQKTVLLQETIEKPVVMPKTSSNGEFQRYGGRETSIGDLQYGKREVKKDKGGGYKKSSSSESEEFGMRIITVAGENKGAIMELSPSHSQKKAHVIGEKPHSLLYKKGNPTASSDGEKSEGRSSKMTDDQKTMMKTSPPMTAFMNSNVQGVNNSILYNCSSTHHDPGVHLSLSRKPNGGQGVNLKD